MSNSSAVNMTLLAPPVDTSGASTAFMLGSTFLVYFMIVGLAVFYSGLSRQKDALSLFMICFLSACVVSIQWYLFGFSLAFSQTGSVFLGDTTNFVYRGVNQLAFTLTAPAIPGIVFSIYELMFAAITPALIFGSVAERIRLIPCTIFVFIWTTVVYDVVAYWTWAANGWLRNLSCLGSNPACQIGAYDFAGGGPVHVAAGFAGLAFCLFVGPRRHVGEHHEPSSMKNVFLGTGILWFGWFGFNAGSELAVDARAGMAAFNTNLAGAVGALTWVFFDFIFLKRLSGLSLCSGAVAGLATITPGAGYVQPWAAIIFGFVGAILGNLMCRLKDILKYDDTLDCFNVHGVGGFVGLFLTGIFASKDIAAMGGSVIPGGAIDGYGISIGYQLVEAVSIGAWSFVVTFIILFFINLIPGLHLRTSAHNEYYGDDWKEMGEREIHQVQYDARHMETSWSQGAIAVSATVGAPAPGPRMRKSALTTPTHP